MAERNVVKGLEYLKCIEFIKNIYCESFATRRHLSKGKLIENIVAEGAVAECGSITSVRPWNYSDFLCRVATFRPFTWFAKPNTISPLRCAQLGWYNKSKNTLCCGSCGVELQHDSGQ